MAEEKTYGRGVAQLKSVDAVRAYQREWLAETRERVKRGEPFAVCNGDDFEEIFNVMDIPVIVINYWNFLIIAKGLGKHYNKILLERGYEDPEWEWFPYGLASTLDNNPGTAPWGGLPKPSIIVGGSKRDIEMRILEIWAQECGCMFYPLEFSFDPTPEKPSIPANWLDKIYDHWDELYDPIRLDLRVKEVEALIAHLEITTGKTFSISKLNRSIELLNEQMEYWQKADNLISSTIPTPVSERDRSAIQQAKWHRGTEKALDFIKAYYGEVKERVEKGIASNPNEKIRLRGFFTNPPSFSHYLEEKYGAVFIGGEGPSNITYRRKVLNNDPIRTLAARQMSFYFETAEKVNIKSLKRQKIDGVIEETSPFITHKSYKDICEKEGMPILSVPRDSDDPEIRGMLDKFMQGLIAAK